MVQNDNDTLMASSLEQLNSIIIFCGLFVLVNNVQEFNAKISKNQELSC